MTVLIPTNQGTHSDTDEARAVSNMKWAKGRDAETGWSRDKHLLLTAPKQVALQAGATPVGPDATPRQAFAAAGCDFTVAERPLFTHDREYLAESFDPIGYRPLGSHKAICRTDNNDCLGVVSSTYHPVQNEAFIALFEYLREDAQLDNIVALNGGKRVFATATVGLRGEVRDGDPIYRYLHCFNSFDGSTAFGVSFSDLRVVCSNQLRYISGRGARKARAAGAALVLRHTKQVEEFAKRLPELLNLENQTFEQDVNKLKPLVSTRITTEQFRAVLEHTYSDKLAVPVVDKDTKKKRQRTLADLEESILRPVGQHFLIDGIGLDTSEHSAWNALQAITQFETHEAGSLLDPLRNARVRLESLYGGAAAKRLDRAREACLALV